MRRASALALLIFPLAMAYADDGMEARFGSILIVNTENGESGSILSGPSPLAGTIGAGLSLSLAGNGLLGFEPWLDCWFARYLWANDRPYPTEQENRLAFVLGFTLALPLSLRFDLSDRLGLSVALGPAMVARTALRDRSVPEGEQAAVDSINTWFWSEGRWFMPAARFRLGYRLSDSMAFGFELGALFPVHHTWTEDGLPFLDQAIFQLCVSIRFLGRERPSLDSREGAQAEAPPSP